jgi:Predicted nucleotidyltransferase
MKNVAIICEYNLFHKGHMYQIEKVKEKYPESCVIALMSGNFVQRGDLAILPKHIRARAACNSGADVILELPYPYSGGTAEYFARSAVSILNDLNGVDEICFGSENGNLKHLNTIADRILSNEFSNKLENMRENFKSSGISFNIIRQKAYEELYNEHFITKPNDILAVEYLKALKLSDSFIIPFQIKRESGYSATKTRKYFLDNNFNILESEVPKSAWNIYVESQNPVTITNIEKFILGYFRTCDPNTLTQYADVTNGIEHLLCNSANKEVSYNEFFNKCRNKKYSDAKIRRVILNCVLKTTEPILKENPLYTNVLAFNNIGREFLSNQRKSNIKIITKPADYKKHPDIINQYEHAINADKLYTLAMNPPQSSSYFIKLSPYKNLE